MSIISDTYSLAFEDPGLVEIDYRSTCMTAGGSLEVNERLWIERANVASVAAALRVCLELTTDSRTAVSAGDDSVSVYKSGHEAAPYINLENRRPPQVDRPGYAWFAMSEHLARRLASELEAVAAATT